MNIGFDFDKVFIDYPPFIPDKLINWLFKDNSKKELTYRFPGRIEQEIRKISHFGLFRPPIEENIAFVQSLAKKINHKPFLISGRFGFLQGITQTLIERYGLKNIFDGMAFNFSNEQPHFFKERTIKKYKLDVYIDDDLPLLIFLQKENKKTKLFWLTQKNSSHKPANIVIIHRLSELTKYIRL